MNPFFEKLEKRWDAGARACIGLDSELEKLPESIRGGSASARQLIFNSRIIDATHDLALAYKDNAAFYAYHGGLIVLRKSMELARKKNPDIPNILDAKRADIGNTNRGYVAEAFDEIGADAVTVNPYFGKEALKPFLERDDKGIIVLCRTSNPGADEFQDELVRVTPEERERWGMSLHEAAGGIPLYAKVAYRVSREWNKHGNCMLVVGATGPVEMEYVRRIVGDMPILAPGFGTQGATAATIVPVGVNRKKRGLVSNSSSAITFASSGTDFAERARDAAVKFTGDINTALAA